MTVGPEVARLPFNGTRGGLILPSRTRTNAGEWFNFKKKKGGAREVKMLPPLRGSTGGKISTTPKLRISLSATLSKHTQLKVQN